MKPFLRLSLIALCGLIIYSNTFNSPFHFDDMGSIVENHNLRDLSNFWHPKGLRWFGFLTFALNYHLGGLNTFSYHIVNLIIHILNAILVYFLVILTFRTPVIQRITNKSPHPPFNKGEFIALFSALLFISHPIQTQAVTYIVQRFASLATLFYLLSIVMYIKARLGSQELGVRSQKTEKRQRIINLKSVICYLISVICAVLSMKTKEIAFTLPFIIVLYEFSFLTKSHNSEPRTPNLKRLLFLLPFLLTLLIIPLSLIGVDKPIGEMIGDVSEETRLQTEMSRWSYLLTQFRVITTYIRLLFLPINQNLDYDYPIYHSFFIPAVFLSFLFLLSILGIGIYLYHRYYRSRFTPHDSRSKASVSLQPSASSLQPLVTRLLPFGIFWFFITLSVESSVIPIRDVIFEHRVYLPSVGIAIAFSTAIFYISRFMIHDEKSRGDIVPLRDSRFITSHLTPYASRISYLLLTTIIILLSIATYQRNTIWQDKASIWEDVVSKSPQKARGYNGLGVAYYSQGRLDDAIQRYKTAIKLNPHFAKAHNNLGVAYRSKGLIDKAIEHYQIALRIKPDYAKAHNKLGFAYYYYKGWVDKAIEHYQSALRADPYYARTHLNLGIAYRSMGWTDKAREHFSIARRLDPALYKTDKVH